MSQRIGIENVETGKNAVSCNYGEVRVVDTLTTDNGIILAVTTDNENATHIEMYSQLNNPFYYG